MVRVKVQALLAELRRRNRAATLADKPAPLQQISGAVEGGAALLVENQSNVPHSTGIEVKVGTEDAEVRTFGVSATADQRGGVGVIGRGDYGMVGQSPDGVGVMGFGTTGLFGFSNDPDGRGVEGHTTSPSGIGVLASAPEPEITALAIEGGNIRVPGAGVQTPTPVFIHAANERNTRGSSTVIDHPMTNGDPNAILIVTRRMVPILPVAEAAGTTVENFSVAYNPRADKWMIVHQSGKPILAGAAFNVLVFKP
jgi:hypothetical protein